MNEADILASAPPALLNELSDSHLNMLFEVRDSLMARLPVKDAMLFMAAAGMALQRSFGTEVTPQMLQ